MSFSRHDSDGSGAPFVGGKEITEVVGGERFVWPLGFGDAGFHAEADGFGSRCLQIAELDQPIGGKSVRVRVG